MRVFVDASLLIYLNIPLPEDEARIVDEFYKKLLGEELFTDVLVLDETIYISRKKYGVSYDDTIDFIDTAVLPYVSLLPIGELEYHKAKIHIKRYNLKPSDALHLAVMDNNGIATIATEDADFDRTHIKRIWLTNY
ncbi:PIN domain nuclease [Archaeoglobales archaeon]|nr:MAG: PIN domain nuclease [Archaeoglobales archaeon]